MYIRNMLREREAAVRSFSKFTFLLVVVLLGASLQGFFTNTVQAAETCEDASQCPSNYGILYCKNGDVWKKDRVGVCRSTTGENGPKSCNQLTENDGSLYFCDCGCESAAGGAQCISPCSTPPKCSAASGQCDPGTASGLTEDCNNSEMTWTCTNDGSSKTCSTPHTCSNDTYATLNVTTTGAGSGAVTENVASNKRINCSRNATVSLTDCSETNTNSDLDIVFYAYGTTDIANSVFTGWSGDDC